MRGSELKQLFFAHVGQTSDGPMGIEIDHAEGCEIVDTNGRKYLDLISGISVATLGHSNPKIVKAVQEQAGRYMHTMVYGEHVQSPQVELASRLANHLGNGLDSLYFVNSGSEAIEAAIKLAKRSTGRYELISFKNAYHGSSHGALSLMGSQEFSNGYLPVVPGSTHLSFNRFEDIEKISCRHAAVVVEVIQSEAGYIPATAGFLQAIRERCDYTGSLLIFDEIQTGYGRTGPLFAFQEEGVRPDIICMAKAMGGGMPLGAIAASTELMKNFTEHPVLGHISTFGGHPVSCAASLAALSVWEDEILPERAKDIEKGFRARLADIPNTHITGRGAMLALHLGSSERMWENVKRAWQKGLLIDWFLFDDASFRIAPPLTISDEQIEFASDILHVLLC
jgi:acetylornithine/succinyldiaminopimelate/putrescine aminotransferase